MSDYDEINRVMNRSRFRNARRAKSRNAESRDTNQHLKYALGLGIAGQIALEAGKFPSPYSPALLTAGAMLKVSSYAVGAGGSVLKIIIQANQNSNSTERSAAAAPAPVRPNETSFAELNAIGGGDRGANREFLERYYDPPVIEHDSPFDDFDFGDSGEYYA